MSFSDQDKEKLENQLKGLTSLLDDIRQVLVASNEQGAKILDNVAHLAKKRDSELNLLDDIRQEMVDNKEQTAKVVNHMAKLISVNQEIISSLRSKK